VRAAQAAQRRRGAAQRCARGGARPFRPARLRAAEEWGADATRVAGLRWGARRRYPSSRRSNPRRRARRRAAASAAAHGGATASRRRWWGIQGGKRSGRRRGAQGSSPRVRFGRRETGKGSSTARAELRWSFNGGRGGEARFRPGIDSKELVEGRRGCRTRRGRLGHEESIGGGEGWPEQRRRRALLTLLGSSSKKENKGRGKQCWAPRADKDSARRTRIAGARDTWSRRRRSRYGRRRAHCRTVKTQ